MLAGSKLINADGTFNNCDHPAKAGSTVYLFLNGTGVNTPGATGEISPTPIPLSAPLTPAGLGLTWGQATSIPFTPLGVWRVPITTPANVTQLTQLGPFTIKSNGSQVRETNVVFWVAP